MTKIKIMKKSTRITLIAIISIVMLVVIGFTIFGYVQKYTAYAEDLVSTDPVVNFNQLIKQEYVHNYQIPYRGDINATENGVFETGHKYFILYNIESNDTNNTYFIEIKNSSDVTQNRLFGGSGYVNDSMIVTATSEYYKITLWSNIQSPNRVIVNRFILIDLSLMFGVSQEPDLEACRKIFISDYYNYIQSKTMFLSGIDLYNEALNDVFANYTYSLDRNALNTTTYYYDLTDNAEGTYAYNGTNWYVYGAIAIPLFTTLNAGVDFQVDYQFYAYSVPYDRWKICFASLTETNERVELGYLPYSGNVESFRITLPTNMNTLLIYARDPQNNMQITDLNCIIGQLDIKASQLDVAGSIASSYSSGYAQAERYYEDYYSQGGLGYQQIFNSGKQYAITHELGNTWGQAWDFIESAFTGIGSIFAVELLPGVPLSVFILVPLMIGLIFFVVKLTKGGGD